MTTETKPACRPRVHVPESILAEYNAGDSFEVIGRRHGVSHMTIKNRLKEMGCQFRKVGRVVGDPRNRAQRKAVQP